MTEKNRPDVATVMRQIRDVENNYIESVDLRDIRQQLKDISAELKENADSATSYVLIADNVNGASGKPSFVKRVVRKLCNFFLIRQEQFNSAVNHETSENAAKLSEICLLLSEITARLEKTILVVNNLSEKIDEMQDK